MSGPVAGQEAAYRKGMVLGLTMAEILLLLLFCFMIAMGASMQRERRQRVAAEDRVATLESERRTEKGLVEALKSDPQAAQALAEATGSDRPVDAASPELDRFWKRLVEGNAVADALEKAGIPRETALREAPALAEAAKASEAGRRAAPKADTALADRARRTFAQDGPRTDDAVARAMDKAAAAEREAAKGGGWLDFLGKGKHDWPPIISLTEADGFHFASGRADLDPNSSDRLGESVVPRILEIAKAYDVDTIEVVGHTDEQPIAPRSSSLDRGLPSVLRGNASVGALVPADNAGLGLARAVSVVTKLTVDPRLSNFAILPLSGGQLIGNDQRLSLNGAGGDVLRRRRIEIRLRQSHPNPE